MSDQLTTIPPIQPPAAVQAQQAQSQLAGLDSGTQENIISRRDRFVMAKQDPRNEDQCLSKILQACRRVTFAATAEYNVKNRGNGPSVRLMEEIARHWKNFEYGTRMIELGEIGTRSRVEIFALDLETRCQRTEEIVIEHKLIEKGGNLRICKTPDDVYLAVTQRTGRRIRECIKKIVPSWVTDLALDECRNTLKSDAAIAEIKRKVVDGFARINVTESMIAAYLRKPVKDIHADEIEELRGIFTAIQSGEAQVSDVFTQTAASEQPEPAKRTRKKADPKPSAEDAQEPSAQTAEQGGSTISPTQETAQDVDIEEVETGVPADTHDAEEVETSEEGDIF